MSKVFGENLRNIRKEVGMKQWQLSIKMDVTAQTISSWEVGRTEPTMGQMEQLCQVLGCDMADLLRNTYNAITPKDRELIDAFNAAPSTVKNAIRTLLGIGEKPEQISWFEDKTR